MTGTGYPVARTDAPVVEARALTPEEQAAVDTLYDELKPLATAEARNYVLARTKAEWQEAMTAKIEADWPLPPADDPAVLASRREDAMSAFRPATPAAPVYDANPNLDPNVQYPQQPPYQPGMPR